MPSENEQQLISAFLDGELDSPFRERIEEQIQSDGASRALYERLLRVRHALRDAPDDALADSGANVWNGIRARISGLEDASGPARAPELVFSGQTGSGAEPHGDGGGRRRQSPVRTRGGPRAGSIWRRRVSLPVPVATAAAALVVAASAVFAVRFSENLARVRAEKVASQTSDGIQVTINVKDVQQLLDILNGRNNIKDIKIELPQTQQFQLVGDPVFVRSGDSAKAYR